MKTLRMMFEGNDVKQLTQAVELSLHNRNESPFFAEKAIPLIEAVYSVILPLKEQDLLFNPEGKRIELFDFKEFLRWTDLVSLKLLYFTLKESNENGRLCRTEYKDVAYAPVDLSVLREYLKRYNIHAEYEEEDFAIAHYNLHIGIASVIKDAL